MPGSGSSWLTGVVFESSTRAERFASAEYGVLHVDERGNSVLVGLADEAKKRAYIEKYIPTIGEALQEEIIARTEHDALRAASQFPFDLVAAGDGGTERG